MGSIFDITPLTLEGLGIAVFCSLLIGFERQWRGKPAGIRTSILICVSAYIFVAISHQYPANTERMRVVGQIVTGVGFLGAGVIIAREGLIQGVTSAAVIWVLAAIGSLVGLQHHGAALLIAFTALVVLIGITLMESLINHLKTGVHEDKNKK